MLATLVIISWFECRTSWPLGKEVAEIANFKFWECPRCGGNMFISKEANGWCEQCLQCSYERELKIMFKPEELPVKTMVVGAASSLKNLSIVFFPVTSDTLK